MIREMAKRRQESRTSDGTVKITRKKRHRPGIKKVSLTGLNECFLFHLITGSRYFFCEIFSNPILWFSLKQVSWKKPVFFANAKFQKFYDNVSYALFFFDFSTLFFKNEFIWKIQNISESMLLHNTVDNTVS